MIKQSYSQIICLFASAFLLFSPVCAAAGNWWSDNGSGHKWTTPANWGQNHVPICSEDITIDVQGDSASPVIESGDELCCNAFKFKTGKMQLKSASLQVNGWGGAGSWGGGTAELLLSDSTLDAEGIFYVGNSQTGRMTVKNGSSVRISNTLWIARSENNAPASGHLFIADGTVEVNWLRVDNSQLSTGKINITDGSLTINADQQDLANQLKSEGFIKAYGGHPLAEVEVRLENGKTIIQTQIKTFPSDLNADYVVDLEDFSNLGECWLSDFENDNFSETADLEPSGNITKQDLKQLAISWLSLKSDVEIVIDNNNQLHQISPYLNGTCVNTCFDNDQRWSNGIIPQRISELGAEVLRYPDTAKGGWHWQECPGAPAWRDSWETDPDSFYYFEDKSVCQSEHTMDIDDYRYWCYLLDVEPFITINFQSGWRYNRIQDSLNETLALVQHCKNNNYNIKYWRIGNEPFNMTASELAGIVNMFVPAMKQIDPNIEIIVNTSNHFNTPYSAPRWSEFFELAGDKVDYADLHCYWRWGDKDEPAENLATWENFINDVPITAEHTEWAGEHLTYNEEINNFRSRYSQYGIDVIISEWNAGPLWHRIERSHYQAALIQSEMMMQFIKGDLFMATRWPGSWGAVQGDRAFIDPETLQPRPVLKAMNLFNSILGETLLSSDSGVPAVPCVSAYNEEDNKLFNILLNKTGSRKKILIENSSPVQSAQVQILSAQNGDVWRDSALLNTADSIEKGNSVYYSLPAYSLALCEIQL
ncbi:Alpha-L-arabinofuranosidase [Sedimentisphaera salicampi]|uniref:Alpha-L-arabinofuranosidase n=1 Tax=Sedimentisphaera salicampi TaxID=1941349 RepID=A0A1W6LMM4_9BACT|nr:Alpha-L-arabinofuranosidase [Sedimentisphaera salicampi]